MSNENANQPAYPLHPEIESGVPGTDYLGLTKREYFAGIALSKLVELDNRSDVVQLNCKMAINYADELLNQLSKP